MSVFMCDICGKHVDSDFKECYEHPKGLICQECQWEVEDDAEYKAKIAGQEFPADKQEGVEP